jgi:hypothetical protein
MYGALRIASSASASMALNAELKKIFTRSYFASEIASLNGFAGSAGKTNQQLKLRALAIFHKSYGPLMISLDKFDSRG